MRFESLKGRRIGPAAAILAALCAAGATLLAASAGGGRAQDKERDAAVRALDRLREKYAAVETVHLSADVKIALYGGGFRAGAGSYEYWAQGERYRVRCRTDRQLGLKSDFDIAYDGKRFYLLDRNLGVLSYRQKDEPRSVAALPNPLFLPVDYLSADDDDCPLCSLRLADFRPENARWLARARGLEVKSRAGAGAPGEVGMPGGRSEGRPFELRVQMTEQPDGSARPARIERVGADGKPLASIAFAEYAEGGLGQFPRRIVVRAFGEGGSPALQAEFAVKTLEVDAPVDPGLFRIGFEEAEAVWDSDARKFVKERSAGAPRPRDP